MSYLLDNISNSNVMLFLIIVLLIFIAITIVYIIHIQLETNNYKIKKMNENVPVYKEVPKDNESLDLLSLTKELETIPKERVVDMTPYEAEQEEKAIISYDELVKKNYSGDISYSDTTDNDDILVKQVDLTDTQRINLESIKDEKVVNLLDYKHEEQFLEELKDLDNKLGNL
jgi:hypothetical protein